MLPVGVIVSGMVAHLLFMREASRDVASMPIVWSENVPLPKHIEAVTWSTGLGISNPYYGYSFREHARESSVVMYEDFINGYLAHLKTQKDRQDFLYAVLQVCDNIDEGNSSPVSRLQSSIRWQMDYFAREGSLKSPITLWHQMSTHRVILKRNAQSADILRTVVWDFLSKEDALIVEAESSE